MATTATTSSNNDGKAEGHVWEESTSNWEQAVQEDDEGNLVVTQQLTVADQLRKRRRFDALHDTAQRHKRLTRDMIRYVFILVDASRWTRQKDPLLGGQTRLDVLTLLLQDFLGEFFDQNPLSHIGFILLQNGEAEVLSTLSSSRQTHALALASMGRDAGDSKNSNGGEFSIMNGLEAAGRSLGHQPRHGSREVVVLTAALSTCDPGDILQETLPRLLAANIRVSCFALSAELYVLSKVAQATGGTSGVCIDRAHLRQWLRQQCVPPPSAKRDEITCEMVRMGFPTRTTTEFPQLVHASPTKTLLARTAYLCPNCRSPNAELPTDCAVCGLQLVLAPHLARSFHHLFPVPQFSEAPLDTAAPAPSSISGAVDDDTRYCHACLNPFDQETTLRFQCPDCLHYFCVDCDAFLHEQLHNCPGCLSQS